MNEGRKKALTSRSAVLCYQTCPRKRFLQYHINGSGVTTGFLNLDLAVGSSVHRGLQHLLEHCRIEHPDGNFEQKCIDEAVEFARKLWLEMCDICNVPTKGAESVDFVIFEQMSLIEALISAFAAYRLPTFLEQYEVLEVEKEEIYEDFSQTVIWLGKADGLLRNKLTNELVVLSIKTASQYLEDLTLRNILHDMQGVSEIACIQNRIESYYPIAEYLITNQEYQIERFAKAANVPDGLLNYIKEQCKIEPYFLSRYNSRFKIRKVQYEYLIKGQRRKDTDGFYRTQNTLIHPLKKDPMTYFSAQLDSYEIEDEYKWLLGAGKTPKNWSKINIWEDVGVDNWIQMLAEGKIQPEEGNAFQNFIKTPDVVNRTDEEIEEWKISTSYLEETIATNLNLINIADESWRLETIQRFFPKNTQSCHNYYGGDCVFVDVCHGNQSIEEGLENGLYQIRTSHHELERQVLMEKGVPQK